jgi:hypothetical protein
VHEKYMMILKRSHALCEGWNYGFDRKQLNRISPASRLIGTCVDAPFGARKIFGFSVARSQVLTCVRPRTRRVTCRRPVWDTRIGSTPPQRAQGARPNSGFPDPVSLTVAPYLSV